MPTLVLLAVLTALAASVTDWVERVSPLVLLAFAVILIVLRRRERRRGPDDD